MAGHDDRSRPQLVVPAGRRFGNVGRLVGFAAAGIVSLAWVGRTALGAVSPFGVLTTPRDEILPAGDTRVFLWSQNSASHPHLYTEYVERSGASSSGPGPRIRVNAAGTQGFSGSPSDPTKFGEVIYQQVKGRQSDLKFFTRSTGRKNPPVAVNTPAWEYRPSASGA